MRITTRLYLISAVTLSFLVALLILIAHTLLEFRAVKARFFLADQIQETFFQRTSLRDQYFLYHEPRVQDLWDKNREASDRLVRQAREAFPAEEEQKALVHLQRTIDISSAIFHRIVENTTPGQQPTAAVPILEEFDKRLTSQLLLKDEAVRVGVTALREDYRGLVEQAYRKVTAVVAFGSLALCLALLVSSLHIARLISRRLGPLHAGVRSIAEGDLDHRIQADGVDEFSDLSRAVNLMTARLQEFTGRLEAETRQRLEAEAQRENETRIRAWFDLPLIGICMTSPTRGWIEANDHVCHMLGYERSELLEKSWSELIQPEDVPEATLSLERVLQGRAEGYRLETRLRRKDGQVLFAEMASRCVRKADGTVDYLVTLVQDHTEFRRAEEERVRLQAQLHHAQKMESLGSLAGGVAHNMNNVLGAIMGMASAHQSTQTPGTPLHRAFEIIVKAAMRGRDLVKGLLGFARQRLAEAAPLSLNKVLLEEAHLLTQTTLAPVAIALELAEDLRPILGDKSALNHALMNLCVNAVEAMPEGGTLTLSTRNVGASQVEVRVQDSGTGMSREVLERALDPFYTTKEEGKGTGLGLPLVYSIVKAHEGELRLHSEPGRGTSVILSFPACSGEVVAEAAPRPVPEVKPAPALRVLLVDDDELVLAATTTLLEAEGHAVTSVPSGEAAVTLLEAGLEAEVVLLDMNMPGWGGAQTLPRIRALRPHLPVVLATGRSDEAALQLVAAHPRTTLLAKPYALEELRRHLGGVGKG